MATEIKNLEPVLQQLEIKCISAKEKMEMLRSPVAGPFKGKDITALAGKLKHVALNTPLRFSMEAMRPQSKNNSRFGNLSHHSFFSRHNPHPHRVTHIQGLNGAPICMVNDAWSVLTPLSPHPMIKGQVSTTVLGVPGAQMPIGDPHSNLVPRLTVGSLSDAWREELRELAARVSASSSTEMEHKEVVEEPQRATQYSAETGRLIPPSSRATTRHTPHQLCRNNAKNKGKDAALSFQDQELVILELLCQILQTDSLSAIQQWLLTAGQREKDLVMRMLQTATANLQPEPQSLSTSMELQSQMSQTAVGLSSRGQHLGRNHPVRLSQSQKQEPIPEEDKPVHMGTAEVLQFHLSQDVKQNQPDPPN
ncbi:thymus, brain and testes associated [Chelydra serpentina]|uniref:Thymus, brain and testes associated n=1 Tax=Chelydra serpentina TaxID=8475 RepID=A0A8T1T8N0_CHESE|nr:thymus, brain and testes associated [Chelydra serpentina]